MFHHEFVCVKDQAEQGHNVSVSNGFVKESYFLLVPRTELGMFVKAIERLLRVVRSAC